MMCQFCICLKRLFVPPVISPIFNLALAPSSPYFGDRRSLPALFSLACRRRSPPPHLRGTRISEGAFFFSLGKQSLVGGSFTHCYLKIEASIYVVFRAWRRRPGLNFTWLATASAARRERRTDVKAVCLPAATRIWLASGPKNGEL